VWTFLSAAVLNHINSLSSDNKEYIGECSQCPPLNFEWHSSATLGHPTCDQESWVRLHHSADSWWLWAGCSHLSTCQWVVTLCSLVPCIIDFNAMCGSRPGKRKWASWLHSSTLLLLFWHAPLGVHSAICRHQPPQRTVLDQVDCFVQCEVVGSRISLDCV